MQIISVLRRGPKGKGALREGKRRNKKIEEEERRG